MTAFDDVGDAMELVGVPPEHRKAVRALIQEGAAGEATAGDVLRWARSPDAAPYVRATEAGESDGDKPLSEMTRAEKMAWRANHTHAEFRDRLIEEQGGLVERAFRRAGR